MPNDDVNDDDDDDNNNDRSVVRIHEFHVSTSYIEMW